MKSFLLIFWVSILVTDSHAQTNNQSHIDSLLEKSFVVQGTPEQVNLLNQISSLYSVKPTRTSKDSAVQFSINAIDLARDINDTLGLAEALYNIGKFNIGVASKPLKATPYLLESLELFTELKIKRGISKCHMQLGLIGYILHNYEGAVKNFQLSLQANEEPTSNYLMALSYTELDSFALAKDYFARAIKNYTNLNNPERLAECYLYLGRLHLRTGGLDSAFHFMNRTIDQRELSNDSLQLVRPYAFISEVYFESADIDNAILYAELSYRTESNKTDQPKDKISLIEATKVLSKAYLLKGNYKKAYFFLDIFNQESNRFAKGSTKQKVADMQSMFEFEQEMNLQKVRQQKDKEIAQEQIAKEKILRNATLIGSGMLLLLLVVLYNRFNLKKRANLALRELNEIVSVEKKRSDDLLLNILPAEVVEELKEKGKADAKVFEETTVLFTDFKEFTRISEQLSASELVSEINECFKIFDGIMDKYGIEKIKTIGDAYMAAGGLHVPRTSDPKSVVIAGLEMQAYLTERKKERDAVGLPAFEMRLGIHTGPAVAGIVGVKKFQYDIWGDTVNVASRMESSGAVGEVNISATTYDLIKSALNPMSDRKLFSFTSRGKIEAKGKGEMEMYFVHRASKSSEGANLVGN